jgi:uncharacterized peroxidase-related enzyme
MSRIRQIQPADATPEARKVLDAVQSKFGLVPNLAKAMANSPAALNAYLQFSGALADGVIPPATREQIALAVAQANDCDYCLAAHCAIGQMVGLTVDQVRDSRKGKAADTRTDAILHFSRKLVEVRGRVSDADLEGLRRAGVSDAEIAEVIANVAVNLFTNYFNHVAETVVDFPVAPRLEAVGTSAR